MKPVNHRWCKIFCVTLSAVLFALCSFAPAQQPTKVPRIGYLFVASLSANADRIEAFRQGLRDLGYVEGKNIFIEWRSGEGNVDRMPALAAELVQLKVDVIVTAGQGATRPAKAATSTIPIVMAQDGDPVANGFVASLARPGGNITGLSTLAPEISGKQLELLKEIVPKLSRVAFFRTSTRAANPEYLKEMELAASAMKVQLLQLDVLNAKDIESGFRAAAAGHAEAFIWQVSGAIARARRSQVIELAAKSRIPAVYNQQFWVEEGGLMTYGVSFIDLDRRPLFTLTKS